MSQKLYGSYQDVGLANLAFGALEAGGFKPVYGNYAAANIVAGLAGGLSDIQIFLPDNEFDDAKRWMKFLESQELDENAAISSIEPESLPIEKRFPTFPALLLLSLGLIILAAGGYFKPIYTLVLALPIILWLASDPKSDPDGDDQ